MTKPGGPAPAGIEIDPFGRPVAWRDTNGAQLLQAQWGAMGTAAQGDILALSTRNAQARRLVDDDGRVVAIRNPGQGWQTALYDAAGRIEESTDPRGARQRATRDTAGRLLRLERFAPGARTAEQVLTYRYAGAWVSEETIADADGTRTTVTERDAQGRVVRETLRIAAAGPLAATLAKTVQISQSWRHDAHGRVVGRTLTDNTGRTLELATTLDAQGLPAKIATVGMLPSWLGGRKPLIDRIQWQRLASGPYATEIAHGDGSVDRFERIDIGSTLAVDDLAAQAGTADGTQTATPAMPADTGSDAGQDHAPLTGPGQGPDIAGLPSSVATPQGEQRLRWNAAGQLSATQRGKGGSRYVYDARGRRVVKLVTDAQAGEQAALSVYEEYSLVAEADAQGKASFAYVHLGWRPVAQIDLRGDSWWQTLQARLFGAAPRHLHTSRAGRVLTMSESGKVVWQDTPAHRDGGVHQPLRYVGQYHDADSGLDYHGARYFDARSGRFISPDPQGVADAVNELAGNLLLDLYAYAGGEPEDYFDPDGAARIRYFAITTKANGKPVNNDQGYTKARWAFIVDDIQLGMGTTPLAQKRNEYAQNDTGLLVDVGGGFLGAGNSFATWTGASNKSGQFTSHYGDNLISIPEFTITMSDDEATRLIASYITADQQALGACPDRSALLPPIKFGTGDADINVTNGNANGAKKQRILACGAGSSADITLRRIAKYEAAAEVNETYRINRNCSEGGCPGIAYYCDATKCYSPTDQIIKGVPDTSEPVYTPSYGRSQFTGVKLVEELLGAYNSFSAEVKTQLGFTSTIRSALQSALERGKKMQGWFSNAKAASSFAIANQAWENLSETDKAKFTAETGLGKREYIDMVRIKTQPPKNSKGDPLLSDAKQALVTEAVMSDSTIDIYLMGIFKDFDKFTIMSHALMQKNLKAALKYRPNASEEYLAAMVARAHNGGTWKLPYEDLTSEDPNQYVQKFLGVNGYTSKGDFKSIRCTENLGPSTLKPGTQGVGIGGLELEPLKIK
jgi:RHS repeat-associated protein